MFERANTKQSSPDLGELLFSPESIDVTTNAEDFSITSIEMATWAARKVIQARTRVAERKTLAERYKARIDQWVNDANKEDDDSTEFFMNHLKPFAEREIGKQRRSRTLHLPGAELCMRKKPDRIEILDEQEAIIYCEEYLPSALIIKKSLSKTVLKASMHSGELPPSVSFIPGEDELYVNADGIGQNLGALDAA